MKRLLVLTLVLCTAGIARAAPFYAAAGVVVTTPGNTTPSNGSGPCAIGSPPGGMSGALNVYIIWYDNGGSPIWSTANKNIVRGWFSGMAASPWFSMQKAYGATTGAVPTSIAIAAECTDNQAQGNFFNCIAGNFGGAIVTANLTPSGCALPNDPQGVYVILPASNVGLAGAGGCHGALSAGGNMLTTTISLQATSCTFGNGSIPLAPNGVSLVDCQILNTSHELGEALNDPNPTSGWTCFGIGSTEVADVCEGLGGYLSGYTLTTPGGQPYSWSTVFSSTTYYYPNVPLYQKGPTNSCASQFVATSAFMTNCRTNNECVVSASQSWTNVCQNFHCVDPTCTDGIQDGDESDVDCGGSCMGDLNSSAGLCAVSLKCRSPADCASGVCTTGTCH